MVNGLLQDRLNALLNRYVTPGFAGLVSYTDDYEKKQTRFQLFGPKGMNVEILPLCTEIAKLLGSHQIAMKIGHSDDLAARGEKSVILSFIVSG